MREPYDLPVCSSAGRFTSVRIASHETRALHIVGTYCVVVLSLTFSFCIFYLHFRGFRRFLKLVLDQGVCIRSVPAVFVFLWLVFVVNRIIVRLGCRPLG